MPQNPALNSSYASNDLSLEKLANLLTCQLNPFAQPDMNKLGLKVITNIKDRTYIQANRRRSYMLGSDTGAPQDPVSYAPTRDSAILELSRLRMFEEWGTNDLVNTLNAIYIPGGFENKGDLSNYIITMFQKEMNDALNDDVMRLAWLGNTDSGNGYYTQMDGFIRLIRQAMYDYSVAVTAQKTNARLCSTFSETALTTLTPQGAYDAFVLCRDLANADLQALPEGRKKYVCSLKMYNLLARYYGTFNNTVGYDQLVKNPQLGSTNSQPLFHENVEVIPVSVYDRFVAADFTDSGASTLPPNFIMLISDQNMFIGTDAVKDGLTLGAPVPFSVMYNPFRDSTVVKCTPAFGVQIGNFQDVSVVGLTKKNYA